MDAQGCEVLEKSAFGCKVTHDITRPDICFMMDKVGGNISQKGDSAIGGELQLCETGKTPQQKISTKDKHYSVGAHQFSWRSCYVYCNLCRD